MDFLGSFVIPDTFHVLELADWFRLKTPDPTQLQKNASRIR